MPCLRRMYLVGRMFLPVRKQAALLTDAARQQARAASVCYPTDIAWALR